MEYQAMMKCALLMCIFLSHSDGRLILCGDSFLQSDTQFCCNGSKYNKTSNTANSKLACCTTLSGAGELYWTAEKICCDGSLTVREGKAMKCCDKETYDGSIAICCNKVVHAKVEGYKCCGKEYLNNSRYLCCHDKRNRSLAEYELRRPGVNLQCCRQKPYDRNLKRCSRSGKVIEWNQGECGQDVFNLNSSSCCAGKLHNRPTIRRGDTKKDPTLGCCYTKVYDKLSQRCCQEGTWSRLIPKLPGLECCRHSSKGYINSTEEICCPSGPSRRKSYLTECCGSRTIEPNAQGCCGGEVFNKSSQQCCRDVAQSSVVDGSATCCRGRALGKDELCCFERNPVQKSGTNHNGCCMNNGILSTYNTAEKECKDGQLLPVRKTEKPCGGGYFDPKRAVCCGSTVYEFRENQILRCCGVTPYDTAKQACPFGEIIDKAKPPRNPRKPWTLVCNGKEYANVTSSEKCCGNGIRKYDKDTQSCCDNAVFDIPTNSARCCRGKAYSFDEENPCSRNSRFKTRNQPRRVKERSCGNRRYDPKRQRCCGGGFVLDKKDGRCCTLFPYHKRCDSKKGMPVDLKTLTSADRLCKRKQRGNVLAASVAACAFPTVVIGRPQSVKQGEDSLKLTLTKIRPLLPRLGAQPGGGQLPKSPKQLHLTLSLPSSPRCRLKKRRDRILVMLPDDITGAQGLMENHDLRAKDHYVMPYTKKVASLLKRDLPATWCQQVCRTLRHSRQGFPGIGQCYRKNS